MPRPAKKPRVSPPASPDPLDDPNTSASHLVSFLTGYDANHSTLDRDEPGSSEDEDGGRDGGYRDQSAPSDDEDEEDEDPDEDAGGTPSKRAKTGLVGTPGSSTRTPTKGTPGKRKTPRKKAAANPFDLTPRSAPVEGESEGIIRLSKADEYFLFAGRPSRTSGNSYSGLVKPLTQAEYESHTSRARAEGSSAAIVAGRLEDLQRRFPQWEAELEEGFNLLFYGFGSKRRLLNSLVTDHLAKRGHSVVVNGHFPGLTIRDILAQIEDTLDIPSSIPVPPSYTTPLEKVAYRIYAYFLPPTSIPRQKAAAYPTANAPLYLTIHNADSPSLRSPRALAVLSLLASSPRIHLIASFDHIHHPLLYSSALSHSPPHQYSPASWTGTIPPSRGFNWIYHNATTFDDYDLELSYQRLSATSLASGLGDSRGGISEEGALQILRSVPPMALRLLKLLITKQIAAISPTNAGGGTADTAPGYAIEHDILQKLAREKFIAREEERFDALMGEFRDHGMVLEALLDGEGRTGRWVWVPLGQKALERVVENMKEVQA